MAAPPASAGSRSEPRTAPPPPPPKPASEPSGSSGAQPAAPREPSFDSALAEARSGGQSSSPRTAEATPPADPSARQRPSSPPANSNEPPAPPGPPATGEDITPERQSQIGSWVDNSDASGGFLGFGQTSTAEKLKGALSGSSELGQLAPGEQRFVMDRMLERWEAGRGDGPGGAARFVREIEDAPKLRGVVGERMAVRSAAIMADISPGQTPEGLEDRRVTATSFATSAVIALSGPAGETPGDLSALRDTVTGLAPEQAAGFARALGADPSAPHLSRFTAPLMARTVEAFNGAPQTPSTSAFVQNAFAATTRTDLEVAPELRSGMATAIAREWHPDDPAAAAAQAQRLSGTLDTSQGRQLLGGGESGKPPLEARINALATIRQDGAITGETLQATDDPWTNQAIVGPQAQETAQRFLSGRGDAAVTLSGSDLDNTVGYAMGMAPTVPAGMSAAEMERQVASGRLSLYGQGENAEAVRAVTDQIRAVGGENPQVAVLPVTYSSSETGPVQLPLFRVTGADGQERFVDNTGRSYDNFEDWRTENKLPPGSMTYPEDGHLRTGADGEVVLGHGNTPETVDTFGEHLSGVVDKAALVGGIVAGGVLIVGSGGTLAPAVIGVAGAVAAGAGGWSVYRGGSELADRAEHGQSIDPFQDETARGLWLNVGAGALSTGAFGSAARLAQLGRAGRALAPLEASAHGYLQASAAAVDTAAIANEGVMLARNWTEMTGEQRAQSLLNMGFWAASTGAAARAGGVRQPGDLFNPIAIRDNLLQAYAPPVSADPALRGNAVQIDYDPQTGVVQGIRHGPGASQADIDLHVQAAQGIQRSLTLEGQLSSLFRQNGEPPAGTVGWAARQDIPIIRERMRARAEELSDPNLSPADRARLREEMAVDADHLDDLAAEADSFVRDPSLATIAARNSRRDTRAERAELPVGDTTVRYGRNEATWTVNELHETVRASAVLREIPPSQERPRSETELTSAVGREGGIRTREFPDRDDGGHMLAYQFLHEQGLINMFPQNAQHNQQVYTAFESEMRSWLEAGGEVRVSVEVSGGDRLPSGELQWGGRRPERIGVEYEVVNPQTGEVVYANQATFRNRKGETFDGLETELSQASGGGKVSEDALRTEMLRRLAAGE
jgi:hypothetical protein